MTENSIKKVHTDELGNNLEIELKLRVIDGDCRIIMRDSELEALSIPGSQRTDIFEATYYDTENGGLKSNGLVYRVRLEGKRWISTLKAKGNSKDGLSQRLEWNVPVEGKDPDITVFKDTDIESKLQEALAGDKLSPLFVTRFERRSVFIALPDSTKVELAADFGEIIAGVRIEQIAEIELELKEGNINELLKLGTKLSERYNLLPEPQSKFERGMKLAVSEN